MLQAALAAASVFLPAFPVMVPGEALPAPKPVLALANAAIMLIAYGGLGLIGLKLAQKIGFADIWDEKVTNKQRFLTPAVIGAAAGVFIIIGDIIFKNFNGVGPIPHPQFPSSIIASMTAGIGEELLFRLFFISLWVWLISSVILKGKWQNIIFWCVTAISALAFAMGHLPSAMFLFDFKTIADVPAVLIAEIILLNGVISFLTAYYFRKYGFLAAVGIHFWADVVWHVIWELF